MGLFHHHESDNYVVHGTDLEKVGRLQYFWQWCYGVAEPYLLQFSDWALRSRTGGKLITPKPNKIMPKGIVLSTAAVCRFIDFIYQADGPKGARMGIGDCVCQTALKKEREPRRKDMVLLYSADIYNNIVKTYDPIGTAEEAKTYLKRFHEAGLIHNVLYCFNSGKWTFVLCNCDNEICVPLRLHLRGKPMMMAGPEIVSFEQDKCLGIENCGRCLARCSLKASSEVNGKSHVDYDKCLGCGLCVSTCQGQARKLVARKDYRHEDILTTRILMGAKY
ncbi:MAG: 4Fe-4S dicluster domain-containing protein [Candidatus Saccharibacteria bacterium]